MQVSPITVIASEIFPHLPDALISPPLLAALLHYTHAPPHLLPGPAPLPTTRHPNRNARPGPHGQGLSVFCTVHLTCLQPDAKLIQPAERVPSTLMDFK